MCNVEIKALQYTLKVVDGWNLWCAGKFTNVNLRQEYLCRLLKLASVSQAVKTSGKFFNVQWFFKAAQNIWIVVYRMISWMRSVTFHTNFARAKQNVECDATRVVIITCFWLSHLRDQKLKCFAFASGDFIGRIIAMNINERKKVELAGPRSVSECETGLMFLMMMSDCEND